MKTMICWLLMSFSISAFAQTPMRSIILWTPLMPCTGDDQLMPLDASGNISAPPAVPAGGPTPGHAVFPRGDFQIRSVCVNHQIIGEVPGVSYAVAGHRSDNGNDMTPRFSGSGHACKDYPPDAPIVFTSGRGEYINLHAACTPGGRHWGTLQVWYTE